MPRANITQLPAPPAAYRPDRVITGSYPFETPVEAQRQTELRVRLLMQAAAEAAHAPASQRAYLKLARKLQRHLDRDLACNSAACPLCMRKQRIRIAGALWRLVDDRGWGQPTTATLLPRGLCLSTAELHAVTAKKLKLQLLADLNRCGAAEADGYLCAGLHGEFDPVRQLFRLHWHLLACGKMIGVADALRHRAKYQHRRGEADGGRSRVRIGREPLTDLPAPLTYLLQSFWPNRWAGEVGAGDVKRSGERQRIPEPFHSEYLLWLDRQPLEDMVLLRKLRVTKHGLEVVGQN